MSLVIIAGRLGKDASVETTSNGLKVVKFSVVENEFKNGEETCTWYDVASFNNFIIEKQIKALKKGSFIVAPADVTVRPSFSKNGQLFLNYDAIVNSIKIVNLNSGKRNESSDTNEENEEGITTGNVNNNVVEKKETTETKTEETKSKKKKIVDDVVLTTNEEETKTYVDDEDEEELPF